MNPKETLHKINPMKNSSRARAAGLSGSHIPTVSEWYPNDIPGPTRWWDGRPPAGWTWRAPCRGPCRAAPTATAQRHAAGVEDGWTLHVLDQNSRFQDVSSVTQNKIMDLNRFIEASLSYQRWWISGFHSVVGWGGPHFLVWKHVNHMQSIPISSIPSVWGTQNE